MKKTGLLCICIILLFITAIPNLSYSEDTLYDIDGNDWRKSSASYKHGYIAGFLVGTHNIVEANLFLMAKDYDDDRASKLQKKYFGFLIEQNKDDNEVKYIFTNKEVSILLAKFGLDKNQHLTRYIFINAVSTTQVVDGLDKVYEDFKNRSIKLQDAVYLVKKQIEGTPQEDIERILLFLRGGKNYEQLLIKDEKGKIIRWINFP